LARTRSLAAGPENLIAATPAKIHPILDPATVASEFLAHVTIVVSHPLPMLRAVLPVVAAKGIHARAIDVDIAVVPVNSAAPVISARPPISESPTGAKR
jgi:hypothetical protein